MVRSRAMIVNHLFSSFQSKHIANVLSRCDIGQLNDENIGQVSHGLNFNGDECIHSVLVGNDDCACFTTGT